MNSAIKSQLKSGPDWILIWDFTIGKPNSDYIKKLILHDGDIYHSGLYFESKEFPDAFNFILHDSLGGGGSGSLLNDAQGKTHGQAMLLFELDVPDDFPGVFALGLGAGGARTCLCKHLHGMDAKPPSIHIRNVWRLCWIVRLRDNFSGGFL